MKKKTMDLEKMTEEEISSYMEELNSSFRELIVAAPYVEIGEVENMQTCKLRAMPGQNGFSVMEIIFELQWSLYVRQQRYPQENIKKLIVSELEITPNLYAPEGFCPQRGVMIKMKYA